MYKKKQFCYTNRLVVFLILVECKLVVRNDGKQFVPTPENNHQIHHYHTAANNCYKIKGCFSTANISMTVH